jgi:hypothetical protein
MEKYVFGPDQLYAAHGVVDTDLSPDYFEKHILKTMDLFLKRPLIRKLLTNYGHKHNLQGRTLLQAHGMMGYSEWKFKDGNSDHTMQDWIDEQDGTTSAILLKSCNTDDFELYSKKSVLIHARRSFTQMDLIRHEPLRVFVPGEGYIEDNNYKLRKLITSNIQN